jgi:peptidyl-prolyl cis-trans isomerase SurA
MNEFHDGILLFEISGRKIWNNVQKDSAGLRQYYDAHKIEFLSKRTAEAKLYMLRSVQDDKMLYSAYKKYSGRENTDQLLLERFNRKNDSLLVIRDMKWFQGDDKEIDDLEWTKGPKFTRRDGFPAVVVIKDILEPVPLPLSAVQSEVMTGYQDYLEKEWVKQLKEKYTVKIDTLVYDRVKNSFRNE